MLTEFQSWVLLVPTAAVFAFLLFFVLTGRP